MTQPPTLPVAICCAEHLGGIVGNTHGVLFETSPTAAARATDSPVIIATTMAT
jgi:hypothetical protein